MSTAIQVDGYSPDSQKDKLRKYTDVLSSIVAVAEVEGENIKVQTMAECEQKQEKENGEFQIMVEEMYPELPERKAKRKRI